MRMAPHLQVTDDERTQLRRFIGLECSCSTNRPPALTRKLEHPFRPFHHETGYFGVSIQPVGNEIIAITHPTESDNKSPTLHSSHLGNLPTAHHPTALHEPNRGAEAFQLRENMRRDHHRGSLVTEGKEQVS